MTESTPSAPSILSSPSAFVSGVPSQESFEAMQDLVHNVVSLRRDLLGMYLDPRRNIDKECGFPTTLSAEQYWDLYQRDAIAARVVECVPKAVWRKQPTIYEDEEGESKTKFEEAWDNISRTLRGERSYYQDESGNPLMAAMERADILSGAGQYAVLLLGLDDGCDLSEPVKGVEERYSMPVETPLGKGKKSKAGKVKDDGEVVDGEDEDADPADEEKKDDKPFPTANSVPGVYSLRWDAPPPPRGSRWTPTLNAYVAPKSPRDYDGVNDYQDFPKDPQDAPEPESSLPPSSDDDDDGKPSPDAKIPCRKLLYVRAFPEVSAMISRYETNPTSPRYGQPTEYLITFNDARDQGSQGYRSTAPQHQRRVHWTRVVHVPAEGCSASSAVYGVERLRQVYRHVLTLQKLYHGDGEMFWKGAFPGISFETHPQLGGQVQVDQTTVRQGIEKYQNGLERFLLSMGMTARMLSPTVADPTPHIEVQLTAIAIRVGIPKRILMGSERGELSSAQDGGEWDEAVEAWQVNDRNPRVIIPVVDRLINVGALPTPCGYSIDWPPASGSSATEKAQIAATLTQALSGYLQSNGASFIAPLDYLTRVWGLSEEEAQAIVDAAEETAAQLKAEQEEQMYADLDFREDELDRGLVADPNDPDLVPEQMGGGAPPFGGEAESNGFPPKPTNGKPNSPAFNAKSGKIVKTIPWMKSSGRSKKSNSRKGARRGSK